eukprot:EG_transcript_24240
MTDSTLNDGWYAIDPAQTGHPFQVYCDMYNGGWTRVEAIVHDLTTGQPIGLPDEIEDPDDWPNLQHQFVGWGSPPWLLPYNVTYNTTADRLAALLAVTANAKQQVIFHCKASQTNSTYGCTVDPVFYPTHVGNWKGQQFQPLSATVLNDGCCFGCCRNIPRWQQSLVLFAQHDRLPVTNVEIRHSGAPGEWLLVEPLALWLQ